MESVEDNDDEDGKERKMKKKKSRSSETLGSEEGDDEASGNEDDDEKADGEESVSSYSSYSEDEEIEKGSKGGKSDTKSVVTFSSQHEKTKMMKMFEQTPLCFTSKGWRVEYYSSSYKLYIHWLVQNINVQNTSLDLVLVMGKQRKNNVPFTHVRVPLQVGEKCQIYLNDHVQWIGPCKVFKPSTQTKGYMVELLDDWLEYHAHERHLEDGSVQKEQYMRIDSQQIRRTFDVDDEVMIFDETEGHWKEGIVKEVEAVNTKGRKSDFHAFWNKEDDKGSWRWEYVKARQSKLAWWAQASIFANRLSGQHKDSGQSRESTHLEFDHVSRESTAIHDIENQNHDNQKPKLGWGGNAFMSLLKNVQNEDGNINQSSPGGRHSEMGNENDLSVSGRNSGSGNNKLSVSFAAGTDHEWNGRASDGSGGARNSGNGGWLKRATMNYAFIQEAHKWKKWKGNSGWKKWKGGKEKNNKVITSGEDPFHHSDEDHHHDSDDQIDDVNV